MLSTWGCNSDHGLVHLQGVCRQLLGWSCQPDEATEAQRTKGPLSGLREPVAEPE